MTKDEILSELRTMLKTTQDWACYHSDEFGRHYDPNMQPDIDRLEAIIDGVSALEDPCDADVDIA